MISWTFLFLNCLSITNTEYGVSSNLYNLIIGVIQMKKISVIFALFIFGVGTAAFAGYVINRDVYEQRGCCSHHGGVCGCSNGKAVCCDGTYSPSCGCN